MKALRNVTAETCRAPVSFDEYGNVVGNVYIRKVTGLKTAWSIRSSRPIHVSQFWTYDPKEFLKNPIYSRNYPPARYLEK